MLHIKNLKLEPYQDTDAQLRYDAILESRQHLLPWIPYANDYNLEKSQEWIKNSIISFKSNKEFGFKIIGSNNEFFGEIRLINLTINQYQKSADIALWIREKYTNLGIATKSIKLLVNFAFNSLELCRIQYMVLPENQISINLIKKIGGKYEGKLRNQWNFNGEMKDVLLFSIIPADIS